MLSYELYNKDWNYKNMGKKKYDCYGPVFGPMLRKYGPAKVYLLLFVDAILCCALLYFAYWIGT